jgi:hypothetical protein
MVSLTVGQASTISGLMNTTGVVAVTVQAVAASGKSAR